jgi:hypothetical protein
MQAFWLFLIVVLLIALPFFIRPLFGVLYAALVSLSLATFSLLDEVCSARLLPAAPWLLWMLWGALIGASLGFWTIAPVFGLRKQRSLIGIAPLILMALVGLIRMTLQHK